MVIVYWIFWPKQNKPNIILITCDTTRLDHLSCYGYHRKTSPHLDLLAKEGQRFERAVAVSSWTLPTHASLFTGLYPATHGAHYSAGGNVSLNSAIPDGGEKIYGWYMVNRLPEEACTLAEILKNAGYKTGGVGAGPWLKPVFGLAQGFDFYDGDIRSIEGRRADQVNDKALSFIRRHASESSFFLFLNYFDPHAPYEPPPAFRLKFFSKHKVRRIKTDPALAKEFIMAQYDAEIFYMDMQIGFLLQELKDLGIYENTCIIVVGDHGEHFGEHHLSDHGFSLFEKVVQTPLIIKWPENWPFLPSNHEFCQQVDIMPTLLKRLGLDHLTPMDGQPLGEISHPIVCELYKNMGHIKMEGRRFDRDLIALYKGRYKMIWSSRGQDPDAGLFDLITDPDEQQDLSRQNAGQKSMMRSALDHWRSSLQPALDEEPVQSIDDQTHEQLKVLGYVD